MIFKGQILRFKTEFSGDSRSGRIKIDLISDHMSFAEAMKLTELVQEQLLNHSTGSISVEQGHKYVKFEVSNS